MPNLIKVTKESVHEEILTKPSVTSVNSKWGDVHLTQDDIPSGENYAPFSKEEQYALKTVREDVNAHSTAIEEIDSRFDDYYTKEDVDDNISMAKEDMSSAMADAWANLYDTIAELRDDIGDISSALDEIHNYAQNLILGGNA